MEFVRYPVCPECKRETIVLFTPPKVPVNFDLLGTDEYVDWDKAHLYCCNANSNCKYEARIKDLTTPQTRKI